MACLLQFIVLAYYFLWIYLDFLYTYLCHLQIKTDFYLTPSGLHNLFSFCTVLTMLSMVNTIIGESGPPCS